MPMDDIDDDGDDNYKFNKAVYRIEKITKLKLRIYGRSHQLLSVDL